MECGAPEFDSTKQILSADHECNSETKEAQQLNYYCMPILLMWFTADTAIVETIESVNFKSHTHKHIGADYINSNQINHQEQDKQGQKAYN